jgi:type 1 fimbria pilin
MDYECRYYHRAHHDSGLLNFVARAFVVVTLAAVAAWAAPPGKPTFTGVITDSMCADGDHSHMKMGPTDAECTKACITFHGAMYVLYDGKQTYTLSDQKTPEKFAGKKVTVTGTLDAKAKTIQVDSIAAAK